MRLQLSARSARSAKLSLNRSIPGGYGRDAKKVLAGFTLKEHCFNQMKLILNVYMASQELAVAKLSKRMRSFRGNTGEQLG